MRWLPAVLAHISLLLLLGAFVTWLQYVAELVMRVDSLSGSFLKAGSIMLLAIGCGLVAHLFSVSIKKY